jgi:hypothetical protein
MKNKALKINVIDYVLQCRCQYGGYCFYRLEEPNGADTCFALATLNFLEFDFEDEKTVTYLQNLQHDDGSYDSIFSAFYAVNSLRMLRKKPKIDHSFYIISNIDQYKFDAQKLPAEMTAAFKRTFYLVNLYNDLPNAADITICDGIIQFILQFANTDNGFGIGRSSLGETALALNILKQLNYPVEKLRTHDFIRECETPTGGFSRTTHGGIATLENTFLAIESLWLLHCLSNTLWASQ